MPITLGHLHDLLSPGGRLFLEELCPSKLDHVAQLPLDHKILTGCTDAMFVNYVMVGQVLNDFIFFIFCVTRNLFGIRDHMS